MEHQQKTQKKTRVNFKPSSNQLTSSRKLSEKCIEINIKKQQDVLNRSTKFNVKDVLNVVFKNNIQNRLHKQKIVRKQQPVWMYIITLLMTILSGTQYLYLFLWDFEGKDTYIFFPTIVFRPIFFFCCSYYMCRNWKVLIKLYLSFDRILVAQIALMISVGGFATQFIPYTESKWVYYSLYGLYPLLLITFSGYYRIMMIYCQWKPCQTILIKLAVAFGAGAYFGLGMYYTFVDGKFTDGVSPEVDKTILSLLLLFAFAGFDYHLQVFSIIDQTDGTNAYNLTYQLKNNPQDMQYLMGNNRRRGIKSEYCTTDHHGQV